MNWRILFIGLIVPLPFLHAQVPGNEHWDVRFGPSGTENTIISVLRHGTDVIVGGFLAWPAPPMLPTSRVGTASIGTRWARAWAAPSHHCFSSMSILSRAMARTFTPAAHSLTPAR